MQLAVTQICITVALHDAKQSAAARARSEDLAALLRDLLEAPDDVRRAASDRARGAQIGLTGSHCVVVCRIGGLAPDERTSPREAIEESCRQELADLVSALPAVSRIVKLAALRGDTLSILCAFENLDRIRTMADGFAALSARKCPSLTVSVGISAPCADLMGMAAAYKEARIAAEVARQRSKSGALAYEDVGIAALLMGSREDTDILSFVRGTLGPLLQSTRRAETLLTSLRAFFAADCSKQRAAAELRVHHKTMCYRLEKITKLTRLDLGRHDDRMVADLALKMADLLGA